MLPNYKNFPLKTLLRKIIFPLFYLLLTIDAGAAEMDAACPELTNMPGGDTCIKKRFSVVFYGIQDSAMTLTHNKLNAFAAPLISDLNDAFSPICVSFANCSTVIIPHSPFNSWKESIDHTVTGSWKTENTINIYFADTIYYWTGTGEERGGYTHGLGLPGTYFSNNKDVIVLSRLHFPTYQTYGVIQHLMGHLFGLPDTFSEISIPYYMGSKELVNKSNCATTGDGICDTSADNYPSIATKDLNNDFYTPPTDNFMSMSNDRCRFTPQQYYFMAKYILKNKMYLH
jgi:hypothetical protein